MKIKKFKNFISQFLCMMLIVVIAGSTTGCSDKQNTSDFQNQTVQLEGGKLGEGSTTFILNVVDVNQNTTEFEISTDKETVGEALLELNLIAGDDSSYGLYVKTVNGITVDYQTDNKYWAFYENDQYAMNGVDTTIIKDGVIYSFKVE